MVVKIIHIIDNFGVGGAQSMLFELYHAIKTHYPDYEQDVITIENRPTDKQFVSSYGVPYEIIRNHDTIVSKVARHKHPVVLFHKLASSHFVILTKLKTNNIPVVAINHTLYNSRLWSKVNRKDCDAIVGVSHHMVEHLKKWYPLAGRYVCIHNGVNGFRYDAISKPDATRAEIITGRINRLCGWKHSEQWLKWIKEVNLPRKMIHDYIGGTVHGSGNRSSQPRVLSGSSNDVRMLGNISNFKDKVSIIKSWDLFLYETNREEGISMAILEALGCGVPVICSNHFGNIEIIKEGINGFVFRDKDHARKILKELCNNNEMLSKLKKTTKEYFDSTLDAKYMASNYIDLIKTLV